MTERAENAISELERIVESLEYDIIFGIAPPRQRLIEDDIMERFDTTRHRARSALAALVQKGLVAQQPKKGAVVRDISREEAEQLYEMRELLQAEAIRKLPLPLPADLLERLAAFHQKHIDAARRGDMKEVFKQNDAFHAAFFEPVLNRTLADAIAYYMYRTHPIRSQGFLDPTYLQKAHADHAAFIRAAEAGERATLIELNRIHIRRPLEIYLRASRFLVEAQAPGSIKG